MNIGIVGCGNLGLSILNGIRNKDPKAQIIASKRDVSSILSLSKDNITVTTNNVELISNSDIIILALKPYTILPFIKEHAEILDAKRHTIVSVATGIRIEEIQNELNR